jgi:hypothetical protein
MNFNGMSMALAVAVIAAGVMPAYSAPAACQGITAEKASRLNDKYRGNGTLRPGDGRVTIQTPCGAVICSAGSGYARPADTRVDGAVIGTPVARLCSWAAQ